MSFIEYYCDKCKKTWRRELDGPQMACTVLHSPGACCHFGEKEMVVEPSVGNAT